MFIKGKDLIFYIEIGAQNIPLCHARTATINSTANVLPSTTYGSGKGETNEYSRKYAYTIKADGLTYIGDLANGFTLQTALMNFDKINWTFTDNENVQWYGVALVTQTEFSGDFDAISAFSSEMLGDGEYTFVQTDIPPTPPVGDSVTIVDQLGNIIAVIPAPGTYSVLKFDTIDCRFVDNITLALITPQMVITPAS